MSQFSYPIKLRRLNWGLGAHDSDLIVSLHTVLYTCVSTCLTSSQEWNRWWWSNLIVWPVLHRSALRLEYDGVQIWLGALLKISLGRTGGAQLELGLEVLPMSSVFRLILTDLFVTFFWWRRFLIADFLRRDVPFKQCLWPEKHIAAQACSQQPTICASETRLRVFPRGSRRTSVFRSGCSYGKIDLGNRPCS